MNVHVHPIYDRLEFINTHTWFTITSDIYEVFMNQEKSFQEVLFTHKSLSYLLVYLQMFHEWDPMCLEVKHEL